MTSASSSIFTPGASAVLLTTQYLDEADALADRLAVLDSGRVLAEGSAADPPAARRARSPASTGRAILTAPDQPR
jgi:ABC-type multidrug transport system ATPase subunit